MASAWHRLRRRNRPGSIPARLPDGTGGAGVEAQGTGRIVRAIAALDQVRTGTAFSRWIDSAEPEAQVAVDADASWFDAAIARSTPAASVFKCAACFANKSRFVDRLRALINADSAACCILRGAAV